MHRIQPNISGYHALKMTAVTNQKNGLDIPFEQINELRKTVSLAKEQFTKCAALTAYAGALTAGLAFRGLYFAAQGYALLFTVCAVAAAACAAATHDSYRYARSNQLMQSAARGFLEPIHELQKVRIQELEQYNQSSSIPKSEHEAGYVRVSMNQELAKATLDKLDEINGHLEKLIFFRNVLDVGMLTPVAFPKKQAEVKTL